MNEIIAESKKWYLLKTNGVANIRTINAILPAAPEKPNFWLPGFMVPRKCRRAAVLRKEFLFYDYALVELQEPYAFEKYLLEKSVPAYFLHEPGTKKPAALTEEEILRIKNLEAFKGLEINQLRMPRLKVGAYIEVVNGPFIGCKGTILELSKTHAALEMNVFGRPTRVVIGVDFLENLLQDCDTSEEIISDDLP